MGLDTSLEAAPLVFVRFGMGERFYMSRQHGAGPGRCHAVRRQTGRHVHIEGIAVFARIPLQRRHIDLGGFCARLFASGRLIRRTTEATPTPNRAATSDIVGPSLARIAKTC